MTQRDQPPNISTTSPPVVPLVSYVSKGGDGTPNSRLYQSAADVVRDLAPNSLPSVFLRMQREGVLSAVDLAGLEKDDLKELGFTMLERSRLLRWSRDSSMKLQVTSVDSPITADPPVPPTPMALSYELEPYLSSRRSSVFVDPNREPLTMDDEEAQQRLDEVEQQTDFWCNLVAGTKKSSNATLRKSINSFEDMQDVRENVLEGLFDLTSERVKHLYGRMQLRSSDDVVGLDELRYGLSRCGLPDLDDLALNKVLEIVGKARGTKCGNGATTRRGIQLVEFEAVLSRLKLAQLLTSVCELPLVHDTLGGRRSVLGVAHVSRSLTAVDYTPLSALVRKIRPKDFRDFFFGHRKPGIAGQPPPVRWVHMDGLDLNLLLALTVKYSLHPLGVEDVIDQCPTKIDRYGSHYFAAMEQLCVASFTDGSEPVRVHGRYVAVFCSGPPLFDTIITVAEPDHDEKEDWPGGAMPYATGFHDAWVDKLKERLEASHSRLRERRANFLMYQILDLSADDLVKVTRAYTTRLSVLEQGPLLTTRAGPEWLGEVQLAQLQLAVVARRIRGLQRLIRRVTEDSDLTAGIAGYVTDVRDHIDEAYEDAAYLGEKCRSILEGTERSIELHHAYCRQRADDRLNRMVFILTGATAIFAPVQFMAGVYGMNFSIDGTPTIPELLMPNGYKMFWTLVLTYLTISSTVAILLFQRYTRKSKDTSQELGGLTLKPQHRDIGPPQSFPGSIGSGGSPGRASASSPLFPVMWPGASESTSEKTLRVPLLIPPSVSGR